ncbi:MAG TPA: bacillithiol transferase BstA [Pyrinomonadaceae bacterium]|nr:bacillithiol transferase BstA [Pyrinomonadaceae bacterium]
MENMTAEAVNKDLRYPVGEFDPSVEVTPELRKEYIQTIADLPKRITEAVAGLSEEQLETPYRPEGWTVRQTVHHVADSHINSLCRFKLALTEENPTIRPYFEDRWAELADSRLPVDVSLKLLEAVHLRWSALLDSLTEEDFKRLLVHPDSGEWTIEKFLALYAWHSRHHTAHITHLRERKGW